MPFFFFPNLFIKKTTQRVTTIKGKASKIRIPIDSLSVGPTGTTSPDKIIESPSALTGETKKLLKKETILSVAVNNKSIRFFSICLLCYNAKNMSIKIDRFFNNIKLELVHTLHPLQNFFIEINSTCNLNCKHCYIPPQQKQSILSLEEISKVLDIVNKEWGQSVGLALTGGEPLMHPKFKDITKLLNKYNFRWSLATNGLLLDEESIDLLMKNGCSTMTISLDGNEKTHEIQRNKKGTYSKTLEVVDMLIKKDFPNMFITSTIHNGNIDSLEDIYLLIKKYGNKITWRINPLLYCENAKRNNLTINMSTYKKLYNFIKKVKEELGVNIIFGEKNPLSIRYGKYLYSEFDNCLAGITTFGVLSNGDIVNCMVCRDKPIVNIKDCDSLKKVWNDLDTSKKGLCNRHFEAKKTNNL